MAVAHPIAGDPEAYPVVTDPVETARMAGLRYITDVSPGIRRKRAGKHFSYLGVDEKPIRDREVLSRIKSLAIPPAWTNVWISPLRNGHLQATGRDAKGRKQYRYHAKWREIRDETKYHRMIAFGDALPGIRERVDHDLGLRGLPRERVLATVVQLLDETAIRVGNEEYARANRSFGLTTLRRRHVDVDGSTLHFHFTGKSGKKHVVDVKDRRVARIIQRCEELPGQELFQYLDEHGNRHSVDSQHVNEYLREITGQDFTAKDFRTWHGTVAAACALRQFPAFASETEAKRHITRAIEQAAEHLGNTPAICRKSYVHPGIVEAYLAGSLIRAFEQGPAQVPDGLHREEAIVLELLREQLLTAGDGTFG